MRERLVQYLMCPACAGDLDLHVRERDSDDHVVAGSLTCLACSAIYPIRAGIPHLAMGVGQVEERTADAFGYEWTRYDELADHYRKQFLDWLRPVDAEFFRDRVVLEAGCGKGRHTALAAEFGARDVVALDLGRAVETAFGNTRRLPNAHIVRADLKQPPVKRVFDYAFSIGVLHHLPDPQEGFRALVSRVRPGGAISAWVYGREGNGWIVHIVSPIRARITSRMPHGLLDLLSAAVTVPLFVATKLVYGPSKGRLLGVALPYSPYLSYLAGFPYREHRSIVFDHLVAPVAHYIPRAEFAQWFEHAGLEALRIEHHNDNSWRGFAQVPAVPPAAVRAAS